MSKHRFPLQVGDIVTVAECGTKKRMPFKMVCIELYDYTGGNRAAKIRVIGFDGKMKSEMETTDIINSQLKDEDNKIGQPHIFHHNGQPGYRDEAYDSASGSSGFYVRNIEYRKGDKEWDMIDPISRYKLETS